MIMGGKARLRDFNKRKEDAERLGHALLECAGEIRAKTCALILGDLQEQIESAGEDDDTEVSAHSIEDVLRAMRRQKIKVAECWLPQVRALTTADILRKQQLRESAAKARSNKQEKREFKAWSAQRAAGTGGATKPQSAEGAGDA